MSVEANGRVLLAEELHLLRDRVASVALLDGAHDDDRRPDNEDDDDDDRDEREQEQRDRRDPVRQNYTPTRNHKYITVIRGHRWGGGHYIRGDMRKLK